MAHILTYWSVMWIIRVVSAGGAIFIASHLRSPYLLKYHAAAVGLLLLGGLALCAYSLWRARPARGWRKAGEVLAAGLGVVAVMNGVIGEARFAWNKHRVLHADPAVLEVLGGHFVIGYQDPDELWPLLERGAIGGIFITRRNLRVPDSVRIRAELAAFQARNRRPRPLIIATDQEGGIVSRLSPPLSALPSLADVARAATPQAQVEQALAYGETHGRELAALGITLNFSPVIDLKYSRPANPLDFNSLIGQRAISADPTETIRIARAYIQGMAHHGVRATLKHFPGLGAVTEDTHHFSAHLETAPQVLEARDWLPFRRVLADTDALLMLGHVIVDGIDPARPASHSRRVVHGLLREQWRHAGVIISDDLSMGAIYWQSGGICRAAVEALNAGVDLLLIAYDNRQYYPALACLLDAYARNELEPARLRESAQRLERIQADRPRHGTK